MKPEIMAEEHHYKRRKQANPRRKNVLNYEKLIETSSETEEDDGMFVPEEVGVVTVGASSCNNSWTLRDNDNTVRQMDDVSKLDEFFCKHKPDLGDSRLETVAEYLQRSGTAVIYPEAPEEVTRLSAPDVISQDESEHDDFAQLLTCPYCDRSYKRLTSLQEHVKYHHDKNQINCSQLERHMTLEKPTRGQVPSHSEDNGNRKFKCCECGKAFKYKHHLKEHLRIHSGEKPYECSNCKKRFSHSGSYSSHISSKKCIGLFAVNRRMHNGNNSKPGSSPSSPTSSSGRPTLTQLRHKLKHKRLFGPPDQQGHPSVKSKQMDVSEYQLLMASQHGFGGPAVYLNGCSRSIHISSHRPLQDLSGIGLELPLLGYAGTLGNNLSEVQKVLQIVDNTVCQQKMDWNSEEISRLRAYMKELGTQIDDQKVALGGFHGNTLEMDSKVKGLIDDAKKPVEVKKEKPNHSANLSREENHRLLFSCQYCNQAFPGPIPLHQHERYLCNMNEEIKAVLPPGDGSTTSSEPPGNEQALSPINCFKDYMSVPKAQFTMNAELNSEELLKVSSTVGLPQEFVKEWFSQWNHHGGRKTLLLPDLKQSMSQSHLSLPDVDSHGRFAGIDTLHRLNNGHHFSANRQTTDEQALDPQVDQLRRDTPSPLNLSSTSSKTSQSSFYTPNILMSEDAHREIPLDLSLPKSTVTQRLMVEKQPRANGCIFEYSTEHGTAPIDLISIKTEVLGSDGRASSLQQLEESSNSIFGINPFAGGPIYTSRQPHSAFPPPTLMSPAQATVPGLRPFPSLEPMSFLPQMAYTYSTGAATFADLQQWRKYQKKPGFQSELLDGQSGGTEVDFLSSLDDLTDRKKMKKTESGKRPHQCQICKKAFKHKHHLIEHSRLHSGEKPYQCDKCGKRFSHSGSYSQHMNHRYSYCKREAEERQEQEERQKREEHQECQEREGHQERQEQQEPEEPEERQECQERDKGGGGDVMVEDMETTELLMRTSYLQELVTFRYSDPDATLRDSREGGGGQEDTEGDSEMFEEVTDRSEPSLR
ncbi:zinc finger E-box-binding homeobox 2-like isoform X1 [Solea senegalensis]|uniref:Zinc finger E-box-binding homeobox 2-like isoform X1 n=1 Tax=Solea senegalensis TaxID=28829 RepID=A0AAV6RDU3_SOLSE|nr:zinc finger E-box-binding homeobox 2-like isoform X1 [Solea senegalensis]